MHSISPANHSVTGQPKKVVSGGLVLDVTLSPMHTITLLSYTVFSNTYIYIDMHISVGLSIVKSFEIWDASMERSLVASTGSSTLLNGSVVIQICPQNIACHCISQYCVCFGIAKHMW